MVQAPIRKALKMMDINLHNLHGGRSDFYDDFYHYGIFTSDGIKWVLTDDEIN